MKSEMKKLVDITRIIVSIAAIGTLMFMPYAHAQNVGISDTGTPPAPDAGLDINYTNRGLLIPRVSLSNTTTYGLTGGGPTTSMLVYNTNAGITGLGAAGAGYYYWNGSRWSKLLVGNTPSDAWLTTGNAGTTAGTHFIGTTDNVDLVFKTNNTEQMRIGSNGNVGIGTTTTNQCKLKVNGSGGFAATNYAAGGGTMVRSIANSWANHDAFVYANSEYPAFLGLRSRGTSAAPSYPQTNDILMGLWGRDVMDGYKISNFGGAAMIFSTTENWSATAKGSEITFQTTPNGTNNPVEVMRITQAGNVGIGTTMPGARLDVVGRLALSGLETPGYGGATDGVAIIGTPNSGGGLLFRPAGLNNNSGEVLFRSLVSYFSGYLGIGTTSPGYQLQLSLNSAAKPSSGTWTITSDKRLKNITGNYTKGLPELLQLQPVTYYYKNPEGDTLFVPEVLEKENVGFIAQDVAKVFPEAVNTAPNGYLGLDIHPLLIAYLNAIKELKAENDELKKQNGLLKAELEERTNVLQTRIDKLEKILGTTTARKLKKAVN